MAVNRAKLISSADKYVERGQLKKAISTYQKLLRHEPDNLRFQLKLGDLFLQRGMDKAAQETFRDVARQYEDQGLALKAIAVHNRMLQLEPNDPDTRTALGNIYQRIGLLNDAAVQLGEAISQLEGDDNRVKRLHTIRSLLALDPENAPMRLRLAEEFSDSGMIDEAADEFRAVCELLRRQNLSDAFAQVAERLLFHQPDDFEVCRDVARHYLRQDYPQRALPKLHTCFKQRPQDVETLELLAEAFGQLRQTHKAVVVLHQLARVFEESGLDREHKRVLKSIVSLDPDHAINQDDAPDGVANLPELVFDDQDEVSAPPPPPTLPSPPDLAPDEEVPFDLEEAFGDAENDEEGFEEFNIDVDLEEEPEDSTLDVAVAEVDAEEEPEDSTLDVAVAEVDAEDEPEDSTLDEVVAAIETEEPTDATLDEVIAEVDAEEEPEDSTLDEAVAEIQLEEAEDVTLDEVVADVSLAPPDPEPIAVLEEPGKGQTEPPSHDDSSGEDEFEITMDFEEDEPPVAAFEPADIGGELQEFDFFMDQGLLGEANSILGELLIRHPNHPEVLVRAVRIKDPGE